MTMKPIECTVGDEISVVKLRRSLQNDQKKHPLLAQYRKWVVELVERKPTTLYIGKRRKPTKKTLVRVIFKPKSSRSKHARIRGFWYED
jgi:hypothetical protein